MSNSATVQVPRETWDRMRALTDSMEKNVAGALEKIQGVLKGLGELGYEDEDEDEDDGEKSREVLRNRVAAAVFDEETDAGAILLFRELRLANERQAPAGSAQDAAKAETTALLALCSRLNREATLDALAQIEESSGD